MVRFQPPSAAGRAHDEHMDTDASSGDSEDEARTIRAHSSHSAGGAAAAKQRAASAAASAAARRRGLVSDSDDDSAMQLPLRGHTPNTQAIARHNAAALRKGLQASDDAEDDEQDRENQWEEEQKYPFEGRRARGVSDDAAAPSKPAVSAGSSSGRRAAASARLAHMNDALLDEEEELLQRQQELEAEEGLLEGEEADEDEALARSHFAAPLIHTQRLQRPPPASALTSFLSSLPPFTRPSHAREYHPSNPLAPAASSSVPVAASPASRSVLEFHRHSFRAGWSSQGHMIVFAGGIDGRTVEFATLDALAVDANATQRAPVTAGPAVEVATVHHAGAVQSASTESAAAQARAQKRRAIQACLEAHLSFHSYGAPGNPAQPSAVGAPNAGLLSSAQLFGSASAGAPVTQAFAAPAFSTPFGFGSFAQAAPVASSSSTLTPFTRLCDAYIAALKSLISAPSASANHSELELTLSTFQLLRCLYSKEEAEVRAPKLSRSMEALLRAGNSVAPSDDLSVLTAQQDPYALQVGREAAFEQGWLQPTVTSTFVSPRVRALQQVSALVGGGSDGVSGTKMQEALAYLIGHDIVRATEACLAAGNFRLATLVSQAGSFNYTGRCADEPNARPALESTARDLARQWASSWGNKDRGIHAFIPPDIQAVIKLMAGDAVVPSVPRLGSGDAPNQTQRLGWIEALGLHYWYVQPKSLNTNVGSAMLNYKTHAFAVSGVVSKPYPPYASYVPVSERRGAVSAAQSSPQHSRGVLEDDDDDDDIAMAQPSQALVLSGPSSASAAAASRLEFFDLRYGLLDLYTQQSRNVNRVLSPQTHVPHVLDHHIAWHLFTTMQFTPLSEFGPHLPTLYMSYIHELELLSADAEAREGSSDLWKWAIYVALASPLPPLAAKMFDREAIIKQILMRHISYSRAHPFALPSGGRSALVPLQSTGSSFASVASKASLPTSLPILRTDDQGFYSVSLNQDQSIGVSALSQRNPPADPTESFLLNRLMIPAAWLHECKAVRAENAAEWSIACFHALHAGDIPSAYRLWEAQLRDIWLLSVINRQEQLGVGAESSDVNSLSTALLGLLQVFFASGLALSGWSESGGLVMSFLEFRRDFASNLAHFTYQSTEAGGAGGLAEATSLQGHAERIGHFRAHQQELRAFLATIDRMDGGHNKSGVAGVGVASRSAHPHLAHLAWSKMSGAILAQLHALQQLEGEMTAAEAAVPAAQRSASSSSSARAAVDVSAGELVSSADRLAVLTNWKEQFLAQYTAPAVGAPTESL